ncbi:MAG: hypothetical protein AAF552_07120 [Pseudomonadota bacterium]
MKDSSTRIIPRMAKGRRNRFFAAEGVDELLSMVLELTAEVSTLRERQYAMERVLEQHNLPVGDAVESWEPTEGDEAHLAADRERLLSTVLRTLEAQPKDEEPAETAAQDQTRAA